MTELLEKALAEAAKLPRQEQNALAAWILEELASEQRWDRAFADSDDLLAQPRAMNCPSDTAKPVETG